MARHRHMVDIIHPGTAQPDVAEDETQRLDQVDRETEAGGKPQHGSGILGDVRLEQGEAHRGILRAHGDLSQVAGQKAAAHCCAAPVHMLLPLRFRTDLRPPGLIAMGAKSWPRSSKRGAFRPPGICPTLLKVRFNWHPKRRAYLDWP